MRVLGLMCFEGMGCGERRMLRFWVGSQIVEVQKWILI